MLPATMKDIMGMGMTGGSSNKGIGMSNNGSSIMSMANNSSNSMTNNSIHKNTIVDITNYQTAQALAVQIQEAFNKDLKSIAPANATAANVEVEKDITNLKNTIDNKGPFMDIVNLVHARIHPNLITAYSLR